MRGFLIERSNEENVISMGRRKEGKGKDVMYYQQL